MEEMLTSPYSLAV